MAFPHDSYKFNKDTVLLLHTIKRNSLCMLIVLLQENKQVVKMKPEYFTISKFTFFALYISKK